MNTFRTSSFAYRLVFIAFYFSLEMNNGQKLLNFSQWSLVNVHNLKEQELLALVVCMDKMEFYNKLFIDTMEKYMKARGVNIEEADLVAAACDYCDHQKVQL